MTNVFLIEDDQDDQEIFSMALKEVNNNIVCHFADDGVDGIQRLKEDPSFVPDVIFIDLNMPKMSGLGCIHEIKSLGHLKDVPIFLYSTNNDPQIIEKSERLGVNFLLKPSSINALIRSLQTLLKTKGIADER